MSTVERHYTHGRLIRAITDGLAALGKTPETVVVDDLSLVHSLGHSRDTTSHSCPRH